MKKIQQVRLEIERIRKANGGILTPNAVVEAAENPKSILHSYFQWQDAEAAHEYRLWQARQMIARVTTTIKGKEFDEYWNAKVTVKGVDVQGYFTKEQVLSDENLLVKVIADAVGEIKYWRQKYQQIKDLQSIINEKEFNRVSARI